MFIKRICQSLAFVLLSVLASLPVVAKDISLDGDWQLSIAGRDYHVKVPHTYNLMPGLEDHAGEAVYQRTLPITPDLKGKTVRLCFEAVYHDAVVYINGHLVGEHLNKGYTPFSFDITKYLNFNGENLLVVKTSNAYTDKQLPYKRSFDWANDGGIYRSVKLHVSGRQTLRYVHVTPSNNGRVRFDIRLFNEKDNRVKGQLTVTNRQNKKIVYDRKVSLSKKRGETSFTTTIYVDDVQLWDFDHPNLYDFTFTIPNQDALSDHFGFREVKVVGKQLMLNGEPVRLPGIEDMPGAHPEYGMAETPAFIDKTVRMMKDLNTTVTRFHWQQDDRMLTAMDEMGILATEQFPWWQQPSKKLGPLMQNAKEQMEEMIEAHYNHPCIFAWGTSNEVRDNKADLLALEQYAKELDPSRMVIAFSNITYRTLADDPSVALDLPTWNEYTGTWHGKHREELPDRLARIDSALNGQPLLITEHGLCEPVFTGGDERRIDDMIYHIGEWLKKDYVCGYIYFCLQDYRTQMGEEGYGKYRIRRHGVAKADLTPKASYYVLRQIMSPIEITTVLPANSKKSGDALAGQVIVNPSDHDAVVVLHNKNTIPSYTLRGYSLRYKDAEGKMQVIALPTMEPGKDCRLILRNINERYAFDIVRPNGFVTMDY